MSIFQTLFPFLVPTVAIGLTQIYVYLNLKKKIEWKPILLGNGILLGIGVLFSVFGFIVAQGEPGSWAGLGFVILLMVTFYTTLVSSVISVVMYFILKQRLKA